MYARYSFILQGHEPTVTRLLADHDRERTSTCNPDIVHMCSLKNKGAFFSNKFHVSNQSLWQMWHRLKVACFKSYFRKVCQTIISYHCVPVSNCITPCRRLGERLQFSKGCLHTKHQIMFNCSVYHITHTHNSPAISG